MNRKLRRKAAAAARQMNAVSQKPAQPETQPETKPAMAAPSQTPANPPQENSAAPDSSAPQDLRAAYLAKFQPADRVEQDLVEQMIDAQWKQDCLAGIEKAAFAPIISAPPAGQIAAFEAKAKLLASLDRTRRGYALQFSRALTALNKLRASAKIAKPAKQPKADAPQPESVPSPVPASQPAQPPSPLLDFPDFCELDFVPQFFADQIDSRPILE